MALRTHTCFGWSPCVAGGAWFLQTTLFMKSGLCREWEGRVGLKASHQLWASQLHQAWPRRRERRQWEEPRVMKEDEAAGSELRETSSIPISSSKTWLQKGLMQRKGDPKLQQARQPLIVQNQFLTDCFFLLRVFTITTNTR